MILHNKIALFDTICIFGLIILIVLPSINCAPQPRPHAEDEPEPTDPGYNCTTNGAFAHPTHCEYYYDCWNGVDTLLKCRDNLLFDHRYSGCNWPEDTDCDVRERPEDYPGTVTPPEGPTTTRKPGSFDCTGREDGHYPDAEDCSGFYQCFHDNTWHFLCAPPLLFNDVTRECDYKPNVNCGERPFPEMLKG